MCPLNNPPDIEQIDGDDKVVEFLSAVSGGSKMVFGDPVFKVLNKAGNPVMYIQSGSAVDNRTDILIPLSVVGDDFAITGGINLERPASSPFSFANDVVMNMGTPAVTPSLLQVTEKCVRQHYHANGFETGMLTGPAHPFIGYALEGNHDFEASVGLGEWSVSTGIQTADFTYIHVQDTANTVREGYHYRRFIVDEVGDVTAIFVAIFGRTVVGDVPGVLFSDGDYATIGSTGSGVIVRPSVVSVNKTQIVVGNTAGVTATEYDVDIEDGAEHEIRVIQYSDGGTAKIDVLIDGTAYVSGATTNVPPTSTGLGLRYYVRSTLAGGPVDLEIRRLVVLSGGTRYDA